MYSLIRDDLVAETRQEPRSRSREATFAKDTRDWSTIAGVLAELCKQVVEDPQEHGYAGRIIGAKLRYINCWQQIDLSGFIANELSAFCDLAAQRRKA